MGIPRFTIKNGSIKSGVAILSHEESHHALSVLRLKRGDTVELLDGRGQRLRGVAAETRDGLLAVAIDRNQEEVSPSPPRSAANQTAITLAAAVIKPDKMDILVQKASELGVSHIAPLLCERAVVHLPKERWTGKVARWRKIADESCKQCGRDQAPRIDEPRRFKDFLEHGKESDLALFPTLAVRGKSLSAALAKAKTVSEALVFIGPEGDFSPREAELAVAKGAIPVTLGPLILRSETAALYVLSCIQYHFGGGHEK